MMIISLKSIINNNLITMITSLKRIITNNLITILNTNL